MIRSCFLWVLGSFLHFASHSQLLVEKETFSSSDTLRGSLNANRTWWDVLRYDIEVTPHYEKKTIEGRTAIKFKGNGGQLMQIDLQQPLQIDSILLDGYTASFQRQQNVAWVKVPAQVKNLSQHSLVIYYNGKPRQAVRPPWDGGWIWEKDAKGRPWMSVACQGLGASVWYPCKDHQSDEPNEGASLSITVPNNLVAVGNGKLVNKLEKGNKTTWRWEVRNPINNYNIVPYIGHYDTFGEVYNGLDGPLTCNYWVLDYELEKAKLQFTQVPLMLQSFEHWFGPYPFYEDGYQLVQSPHLGMEHQSAIAYGNKFLNGYLGRDLSSSGWGNKWDFIIIHESGHEWFGNNITSTDIADMWIHEGFTNYSETLFTETHFGKKAGEEYLQGIRQNIRNDRPIIGQYGVNHEGSGDMYAKGANLIHTIRTIMQNDSIFTAMLRQMNKTFYHQTVTTQQIERFIQQYAAFDCTPLFNQYLRSTSIPRLDWKLEGAELKVRFVDCDANFFMPVYLPAAAAEGKWKVVQAKKWTSIPCSLSKNEVQAAWNKNLYIRY